MLNLNPEISSAAVMIQPDTGEVPFLPDTVRFTSTDNVESNLKTV